MSMSLSREEYVEALKIQLEFIENSCNFYDQGRKNEALRIATSISTLLINTKSQISILKHLLKEDYKKITLLSTNTVGCENSNFFNLLSDASLMPYLDNSDPLSTCPGPISVEKWLEQNVIGLFKFRPETIMRCYYPPASRELLIRVARDKDGGAHFDKSIKDETYKLLKGGGHIMDEIIGTTTAGLHYVSLRQLGYEVLHSNLLIQLDNLCL